MRASSPVQRKGAARPSALVLAISAIMIPMLAPTFSPRGLAILCLAASILAVTWVMRSASRLLSAGGVFVAFYTVFHFGLVVYTAVGMEPDLINSTDHRWATDLALATAAVPATSFLLWFAAAYGMWPPSRAEVAPSAVSVIDHQAPDRAALLGPVVLGVGLLIWWPIFLASGVGVRGQYVAFLEATEGSLTPYAYLFISLGMAIVAGSRSRLVVRGSAALFVVWMVPAFLLGLRGEVLIPLLAFGIARARGRQWKVRTRLTLLAGVGALAAGAFVRVARTGLSRVGWESFNPLAGLTELGYTIRPMINVLASLPDERGYVGLGTYTAPVERLVLGQLFGLPVTPTALDDRVFSTFISAHYGPIGGSISAEAFRAGGFLGVALVGAIVGLVVARMDGPRSTPVRDAAVAMISGVLLLWVRNDFTPVPLSMAFVVLLVAALSLGTKRSTATDAKGSRDRGTRPSSRLVAGS